MSEVTRETFKDMNIKSKVDVLFDICTKTGESVERLEKAQAKSIWWNRAGSTIGGVIGGILTVLGLKIFK